MFLKFQLDNEDEDWPPFAEECLPVEQSGGGYKILTPPSFVKDLSVADIIEPATFNGEEIESWRHLKKSNHTTMWVLSYHNDEILREIEELLKLGYNVETITQLSHHSVDIDGDIRDGDLRGDLRIEKIDDIVDRIAAKEGAVAFPSFRHEG